MVRDVAAHAIYVENLVLLIFIKRRDVTDLCDGERLGDDLGG